MSKASKILQRIEREKREKKKRKPSPQVASFDDDVDGRFSVRADTLWWLLSMRMIERHEYYAVRQLQGAYLEAQIQPPKCLLGRGAGYVLGVASGKNPYPNEGNFSSLRYLAKVRNRLGATYYKILELTFCHYWAGDDKISDAYKRWLRENMAPIGKSVHQLAYVMGYTTETLYAREKRDEANRLRELLSGQPAGLHSGRDRPENDGGYASLLRLTGNVRSGNRTAAQWRANRRGRIETARLLEAR